MATLSAHRNIVEMPCVFVDRIPSLRQSMELYPQALPSRLNPDGFGRNMSLFCVMKRYWYFFNLTLLRLNDTSILSLKQCSEVHLISYSFLYQYFDAM